MVLTLQQVFGVNATQTVDTLTITKADLPLLTSSINNRPEQLLVAILLHFYLQYEGILIDENRDFIVDEDYHLIALLIKPLSDYIAVSYWKQQFLVRDRERYIQDTILIDLFITPPPENTQILTVDKFS